MNMYGNFVQKGTELAKEAVEEDNKQNWAVALELYTRALEYFSTHLKYDKNPKQREMISNKFKEYLDRAEYIKGILDGRQPPPEDAALGRGSSALQPWQGGCGGAGWTSNQTSSGHSDVPHYPGLTRAEGRPGGGSSWAPVQLPATGNGAGHVQQGIELAREAVEQDNKQNWAAAVVLYTRALEYFVAHLKHDRDPRSREMIANKIREYLNRAEYIKGILDGQR